MDDQGKRILIVEDSQEYRELLMMVVSTEGYEFDSARDGIEALEKLRATAFDLIISDVLMPRMDGFQLCRAVKTDEKLKAIPVVFYSGQYTDAQDAELLQSLGAALYLHKPMQKSKLLENIRQVLELSNAEKVPAPVRILDDAVFAAVHADRMTLKLTHKIEELERERSNLQASEARYRMLFDCSREAMMTIGPPLWKFSSCNPATVEMFGASEAAEFTALGPWDLSPERQPDGSSSADKAREAIEKTLRDGFNFFEWTHRRLDGADFPTTVLLTSIEIAGEKFCQATVRDITGQKKAEHELCEVRDKLEEKVEERTRELETINEKLVNEVANRKKSETALRESELRYRTLFAQASIGIFILSVDGKVVELNESFAQMHGYSVPEMRLMNLKDLDTPATFQLASERIRQILTGEPLTFEVEHYHKDGHVFPLEVSVNLITVSGTSFMQCLHRDITRHKQAEEALKKSERKYRLLAENSITSIWTANLEGSFTYVSPAIEKLLGYTTDEFLEKQMPEIVVKEDYLNLMVILSAELAKPQEERISSYRQQIICKKKDGSLLDAEINVAWLKDEQGNVTGIQGSTSDITEHKQAEQDRIAREVAEKANLAKSIFVANMSHEIRTPLNAVMGFAQVLERDPTLTPQQAEHIRTIHRSGNHLLHLINDILDMSKIEAGRITLNESVFCLHNLLDDLLLMFRNRADSQGLQLLMERDENVPRFVTADEGKLRQVLMNLLGNAVKFTAMGGVAARVRAEAVEEKTGEEIEPLRLVVEVEDSGPGIPEEDIGRIFDPFQQGETGVKTGGTGLGLAISRRFVEMMGGDLTVKSRVGTGSCFRFDLLVKPAAAVAKRDKRASRRIVGLEPGTGPFRILVVDDVPINSALLCALLRPVGFEVAEASNGLEALEIFAKWSPHAILMDMRMPVMDGYEATRRLKSTETGRATPVIAITASVFEDTRAQVMATGVDAYIRKPFRMEEICEALGKCLGLRYVFADGIPGPLETKALTVKSLAALPKDLIVAMQQAITEGNMARLMELITQVEKLDSSAAHALQTLADQYDYEKLCQWLEKGVTGNE